MADDKQKQIDDLYAKYQKTLELLNDALDQLAEKPKEVEIEGLKITVRLVDKKDLEERKLSKDVTGVVITKIAQDSPVNYLETGNIIVEAQKKKINTIGDLENIVKITKRSSEKTLLIAIYNNQNQRRYIGVKLD